MEVLNLESTQFSPYIHFDPVSHLLEIRGVSRPENTVEFYQPVLNWLDSYIELVNAEGSVPAHVRLVIDMDYFNSISAKYLMGIILKCKALYYGKGGLVVEWHYKGNDEENQEWGEDFSAIAGIPFEMHEK